MNQNKVSYLTPKDIAKNLNISLDQVYKLISTGRLKAYNFGLSNRKLYRISNEQFQNYINNSLNSPNKNQSRTHKNTHYINKKTHQKSVIKIVNKESILQQLDKQDTKGKK